MFLPPTRGLRIETSAKDSGRNKVVLIRLDKIGDLICTLPVDQVIDDARYEVTWVVQKGLGQIVDLGSKHRKYFELDKKSVAESRARLSQILNDIKPDIAVSFQAPWWVNFELFKAQVPLRAGVKSQWHSFLFLNQGLRQKRSLAVQHEFDYNLDLILTALQLKPTKQFLYFEIERPADTSVLEKYQLQAESYVVVHPGMMGSALNWKQSKYIEYIERQLSASMKVVITGTESDEPYLDQIKAHFDHRPEVVLLQSKLGMKELIQVLAFAKLVVAPSTGVAHLAASVGAKVYGIYSPIRVHHPRRWAARGPRVQIFLPTADATKTDCMDSVDLPL